MELTLGGVVRIIRREGESHLENAAEERRIHCNRSAQEDVSFE